MLSERKIIKPRRPIDRWLGGALMICGAAAGAGVMYLCDPNRGKARRSQLRQKGASAVRLAGRKLFRKSGDWLHRAAGALAQAHSSLQANAEPVDDVILAQRVRSHLGHIARHANAIRTEVSDGVVALRGPIALERKRAVIDGVLSIPGVKGVRDLLIAA